MTVSSSFTDKVYKINGVTKIFPWSQDLDTQYGSLMVTEETSMTSREVVTTFVEGTDYDIVEKNVVFITLGCPTVYATCIYVHKLVLADGYDAELVAGVTSICAVAAKLNTSLCERAEPLIVLPGSYKESSKFLDGPGNKVLMKSASEIGRVRDELREKGLIKNAGMVERCGLPGEKVYYNLEEIDPASSYFSVILVKEKEFDK